MYSFVFFKLAIKLVLELKRWLSFHIRVLSVVKKFIDYSKNYMLVLSNELRAFGKVAWGRNDWTESSANAIIAGITIAIFYSGVHRGFATSSTCDKGYKR